MSLRVQAHVCVVCVRCCCWFVCARVCVYACLRANACVRVSLCVCLVVCVDVCVFVLHLSVLVRLGKFVLGCVGVCRCVVCVC